MRTSKRNGIDGFSYFILEERDQMAAISQMTRSNTCSYVPKLLHVYSKFPEICLQGSN